MVSSKTMSAELLSLVPLGDALAMKEGFSLEGTVVALRTLDGRDKFTKMIQYVARFFYWRFATSDPALSQRAFKLYKSTQGSRKAFRLLKILDEVVTLRRVLLTARKNASDSRAAFLGCSQALISLRCLVMGAFWTLDNLGYLAAMDMVNFKEEGAEKGVSRSWSVSSALSILLGLGSLKKTGKHRLAVLSEYAAAANRRPAAPNDNDNGSGSGRGSFSSNNGDVDNGNGRTDPQQHRYGEAEDESRERVRRELGLRKALAHANAEHFKSWLMILKGALDLTCAVNGPGVDLPKRILGRRLNDGVIGAVGCASALCGLYSSWPVRREQQEPQQQPQPQPQQQPQPERQSLQEQNIEQALLHPSPPPTTLVPPPPPTQQLEQELSRNEAAVAA